MELIIAILAASVDILQEAAAYIVMGIVAGGMLRIFLPPEYVASRLGNGRFMPIFRAAMLGIPLPLCFDFNSCHLQGDDIPCIQSRWQRV